MLLPSNEYLSDRGIPLVYHGGPPSGPLLTVENYCKWYNIFAVMPDGSVTRPRLANEDRDQVRLPSTVCAWHDHVPHPTFCLAVAAQLGYEWHDESFEMIVGRYTLEVRNEDFAEGLSIV